MILTVVQQRRMEAENLVDMTRSILTNFTRDFNTEETNISDIKDKADAASVVSNAMLANATAFTDLLNSFRSSLTRLEELERSVVDEAANALVIAQDARRISREVQDILDEVDVTCNFRKCVCCM